MCSVETSLVAERHKEISQPQGGWWKIIMDLCPEGTTEKPVIPASFQRVFPNSKSRNADSLAKLRISNFCAEAKPMAVKKFKKENRECHRAFAKYPSYRSQINCSIKSRSAHF